MPPDQLHSPAMPACKNCDTPLENRYCPQCGQRDIELDRPLPELLGQALRETLDVDGRAARTVWTLIRRPGVLTSEYLAGRRRRYSPPFRLYLIISLLFFVLTAWVAGQGILLDDGQTLEVDAPGQARLFADYVPRLMFILLPVFALFLKVAFRKRLYFDHLIHSLHLHSALFITLMLMLPLERAAAQSMVAMIFQLALFAYLLTVFVMSVRHVYRVSWPIATIKSFCVMILYMALVAAVFEAASPFAMPGSAKLPFLTD
ncbi:MAG: DUF3667 domain-containing protein [Woeseiaceae bacterium]